MPEPLALVELSAASRKTTVALCGFPRGGCSLSGCHAYETLKVFLAASTEKRVRLGMTDLEVSPIAFGTWQLGGEWGEFDEQEAIAAIRQAQQLGVNLFDTAHGYGFGASERVLGKAPR